VLRGEATVSRAAVADLYALQALDLEIDRRAGEQDALSRAAAEDATRPARETLARAGHQAQQARAAAQAAEAALREAEARIQKQEQRLYGGATASRDLAALQTELAHLKGAHADQEERALTVMLAAEEAEAAERQAREALSGAARAWEQRRGELRTRLTQEAAHLSDLRARRATQAAAADAEAVRRYDAIRRTHGGRAVALAQGGTCTACRVVVSSGTLQRARSASELVPCTNCGRILYVP
jgi:predicted  nucleic acid-binding Zn-ribbon protein